MWRDGPWWSCARRSGGGRERRDSRDVPLRGRGERAKGGLDPPGSDRPPARRSDTDVRTGPVDVRGRRAEGDLLPRIPTLARRGVPPPLEAGARDEHAPRQSSNGAIGRFVAIVRAG